MQQSTDQVAMLTEALAQKDAQIEELARDKAELLKENKDLQFRLDVLNKALERG